MILNRIRIASGRQSCIYAFCKTVVVGSKSNYSNFVYFLRTKILVLKFEPLYLDPDPNPLMCQLYYECCLDY